MKEQSPSPRRGHRLPRTQRSVLIVAAAMLFAGSSEARRPPPPFEPPPRTQPLPWQQGPDAARFVCDTEIEPPASVREAHREYFACATPELDRWLARHPETVSAMSILYHAWRSGRRHDLRDRVEAGRWARRHSVDFSMAEVELTKSQLGKLAPVMQAPPVRVAGSFERFFVDRDSERLFLTSTAEGLVSLDIGQRYAFELEGKVGTGEATDFFIVDESTAIVEETPDETANGDLVVLDISDRSNPREVTRLRGVIPSAAPAAAFTSSMAGRPPTFEQYILLREGRLETHNCGRLPVVSTHTGIHCRPDGSCYKRERLREPNDGVCERIVRPARGFPVTRRQAPSFEDPMRGQVLRRESAAKARPADMARPAPSAPRPAPSAPSPAPSEMPSGGEGGAGSLSQMMLYGSTLYVLSGVHGQEEGWLTTFDITQPRRPTVSHLMRLDNGPEALQRHDNLLLVAGRDALVTASLGIPTAPRILGEHRQRCPVNFDPVVVQGSIAYRTIIVDRPTRMCSSMLEVIELSQPHQPVVRSTHRLARPRGLAVLGERLFVADETRGIHVFDLADAVNPRETGVLPLRRVKDLVLSGFDLYALTPDRIETYWAGPLFETDMPAKEALGRVEGFTTVRSGSR